MQTHPLQLILIRDENYFFTTDPTTVIVSMAGLLTGCKSSERNSHVFPSQ